MAFLCRRSAALFLFFINFYHYWAALQPIALLKLICANTGKIGMALTYCNESVVAAPILFKVLLLCLAIGIAYANCQQCCHYYLFHIQ